MKNWKIKFIAIPDFFPTLYYIDLLLAQFILKFHPSYLDTFLSLLFWAGNLHVGSFPGGAAAKNPNANTGDTGLILGSGRSLGEGNGNPFQHSCLGNPMDRGAPKTPLEESLESPRIGKDWATVTTKIFMSNARLFREVDTLKSAHYTLKSTQYFMKMCVLRSLSPDFDLADWVPQ